MLSTSSIEDDNLFSSPETLIYISYTEYSIEDESKCNSLALHWAKNNAWKMKHQPNGIDGKRAIEIYKKLTSMDK